MRDVQAIELRVAHKPGTAASLAAARRRPLQRQAIAAKTMVRVVDNEAHESEHNENIASVRDGRRGGNGSVSRS